jgi:pilus assembly protein Flp/PilA
MAKFIKMLKNEKGATAIEYGLIAALIAVAAIGAMTNIGTKLGTTFNNVSNSLYDSDQSTRNGVPGTARGPFS